MRCTSKRRLLQFVSLNLGPYLVCLSLQLVTECFQSIRALALSFCAFALRFREAEAALCLSHEILDVLLDEHPVLRSIADWRSTGLSDTDACGQSLGQ